MNKDKELEEAIKVLRDTIKHKPCSKNLCCGNDCYECILVAIETVVQALKNSISKKKIEDKKQWLEENILENDYANDFDKDIAEYQVNILGELLEDK